MASSSFIDKATRPDDAALARALGKSKPWWDSIIRHLEGACDGVVPEWKFYGPKYGWQLKLVHKKRALLYMIPRDGRFTAALALRPGAVAALPSSGLPEALIHDIETARPSSEGRPARIEVTARKEVEMVKTLVALKLGA
jgi:uncharacterized protein DUF3788